MATFWYFRAFDEEMGPVPFSELVEMVRSGAIDEDDPVRSDWEERWQRARSVPGLFYMAQREPAPETDDAVPGPIFDDVDDDYSKDEREPLGELPEEEPEEEPWRPPWLEKLIGLRDGWLESQFTAGGGAGPSGASGSADATATNGRFALLVDQAVDRLEHKDVPPDGRVARLLWRTRRAFAAVTSPIFLRQVFRLGAALLGANLAALWVDSWAARQALRFPSHRPTAEVQFPLVGTCTSEEYMLLMMMLMILAGILSYGVAILLESTAEDA